MRKKLYVAYIRVVMKHVAPLAIRRLRSQMELKALSLKWVAAESGVNYTIASAILSGKRIDPENLKKISCAIKSAPAPDSAIATAEI